MTILVTGGTGTVGSKVLEALDGGGAAVRVLTRSPDAARLPAGTTAAKGDLSDLDSVRSALAGCETLFLLAPNVADELTHTMLALNAARDAGVKGVVYLSVFRGEQYADVPHFIGKHTVERMIEALDLPVTVLRPAYFIQNDLRQKDALLDAGVYGMPIGSRGLSMVDTRDIGEAAAIELLRRDRAAGPLPRDRYELVGPDALTGNGVARIWAEALGRPVRHAGNDLDGLEERLRTMGPAWLASDLRLMFRRYGEDGAVATPAELDRLTTLLGHPPRSYRAFAEAAARQWTGH